MPDCWLHSQREEAVLKVAISIGHNPRSPGAAEGALTEYSQMAAVAGILVSTLAIEGHEAYLIGTGLLNKKVLDVNQIGADCAVELHLNRGGGYGCETLYCPGSATGKIMAETVHKEIMELLPFRDRGVKEGWYHMVEGGDKDYFLENTNCPAIITEPFFIDTELEKYNTLDFIITFVNALRNGLEKFRAL